MHFVHTVRVCVETLNIISRKVRCNVFYSVTQYTKCIKAFITSKMSYGFSEQE
jgi:hypothetical protein